MNEQEILETENHVVFNLLQELLDSGKNFSEIRLATDGPVMIKTSKGWIDAGIAVHPTLENMRNFLESVDADFEAGLIKGSVNRPLELGSCRLRINAYMAYSTKKLMASIRKIPLTVPTLQETGLPGALRVLLENTNGLILIAGPTGAGKTTSMASMAEEINNSRNANIITIEDPIEFQFKPNQSIFSQREVGLDCQSFYDAVKDSLRQSPDVIVIGEICDKATAEQAIIASESGHLVIGTLHSGSAAGTVGKLLGYFGADERESKLQSLADNLIAIVHQTLIPKSSGDGYALAVDFLANQDRQYSKILGDSAKVQSSMERHDPKDMSICLADSIIRLINSGVINKADAAKRVSGNASVYEKISNIK